jgi:hypothetical protein
VDLNLVKEIAVLLLIVWGISRLAISCGLIRSFCPISANGPVSLGIIDFFVDADIKQTLLHWLSGNRALAKNAQVDFQWEEPLMVGNTVSFTVQVIIDSIHLHFPLLKIITFEFSFFNGGVEGHIQ